MSADQLALIAHGLDARLDLHQISFRGERPRWADLDPAGLVCGYWVCRLSELLVAVNDPTTGQVVGTELHHDPVLRKDTNIVLTHLAGDVGKHLVAVRQLDPEHRVRESLDDTAFDLDDAVFLRHSLRTSSHLSDFGPVTWNVMVVAPVPRSSAGQPRGTTNRAH